MEYIRNIKYIRIIFSPSLSRMRNPNGLSINESVLSMIYVYKADSDDFMGTFDQKETIVIHR